MAGLNFLHTPGPTFLPEEILNAMNRQPLDFGDERIAELVAGIQPDLQTLFQTRADVFIYIANGHGGWEATLSNICDPGDTVVIPMTGFFSSRWVEVARALGLEIIEVRSTDGHDVDYAAVEKILSEDRSHKIKAVLGTQIDTGAGVAHDIKRFRGCLDAAAHPALLVADCIASLGAAEFRMDEWGVDVAITGSQKALMMPPGLALVAANDKAKAIAAANVRPKLYWDWQARNSEIIYHRFCGTLPIHLLFGLRAALDLILEEGLERRIQRHQRVASAVQAAVAEWVKGGDMEFFVPEENCRSVSVTAIRVVSDNASAETIRKLARHQFNVSIAGGLASLENQIIRIGHLGVVNTPMILGCLGGLEATFEHLGVRYSSGLSAAAKVLSTPL